MRHVAPLVVASLLTLPLVAQDRQPHHWRIGLGLGAGSYDYETDGSDLDGKTDAGAFRLMFEGVGERFGGGLRLESFASDDDIFADRGAPDVEATNGSMFGHFTYRIANERFLMPIRAGLLLNSQSLSATNSGDDVDFVSVGPMVEIAPDFALVHGRIARWSLFGELGLGAGATVIDVADSIDTYSSTSTFVGLELGTRARFGIFEVGLSWIGRWQSMDESDVENGVSIRANDAKISIVMLQLGVAF